MRVEKDAMFSTLTPLKGRVVAERQGIRLVIAPHGKPGIGDVITEPNSHRLIAGVEVESLIQYPDDRGCFSELFRFGGPGIARDFALSDGTRVQVSITTSYPGVIKAIHYHFDQIDLWAPVKGMFQVVLCDLREASPSCGSVNTLFVGTTRPWKLRIPPGVAHGYKVVGTESARLVYSTNRFYNPEDEGRIPFDDPDLNYDWQSRPR